jgi:hypothetical protein
VEIFYYYYGSGLFIEVKLCFIFVNFKCPSANLILKMPVFLLNMKLLFQAIQDLSSSNTTKPVQDKLIGLNISQPKPQQAEPVVVSKPPPSKPVKQTDLKTAVSRLYILVDSDIRLHIVF